MKLKKILLSALIGFTLFSCEDAYRVDAADEITDLNAIVNMDDLQRAVTGVYSRVGGTSFVEWSAYFTDECRKPSSNRGQGVQVHTWSINNGTNEPQAYYAGLYGTINSVNVVLSKLDAVPTLNLDEQNQKEVYRAELRTIRAMAHFDLMRFFATSYDNPAALATPIVSNVIVFEKLPRNTVGEVTDFVNFELSEAYDVLSQYSDNSDVTRVTSLAVRALQARIALYTKDYENAIVYSQDVIDAVPLAPSPTDYLDIWSDASDSEIVFKLKRVTGNGQIGTLFKDTNGDVFFNVSNDLFQNFNTLDIRYYSSIDQNNNDPDDLQVGKYLGSSSNFGLADIKLFRVAEMYLIQSEAYALKATPDLPNAEAVLNLLRASRNVGGVPPVTFSNQNDAINKILLERRLELCFEGHRFFDLKRFNLGVDRLPSDVLLNAFAEDLPAGDHLFTLPIPQQAIFANDLLTQNPGY